MSRPKLDQASRTIRWTKKEVQWLPTVRRLYVEEGLSAERMVNEKKIPVTPNTLRRWIAKHGLAEERDSFLAGPEAIAKDMLDALADVVKDVRSTGKITPADADAFTKITNSIEKLNAKISYRRISLRVLHFIIDYLADTDPALLRKFSKHLGQIRERIKVNYGS